MELHTATSASTHTTTSGSNNAVDDGMMTFVTSLFGHHPVLQTYIHSIHLNFTSTNQHQHKEPVHHVI